MPTNYMSSYGGMDIMARVATGGREIAPNLVPDRPNRQGEVLTLSGSSPTWTQDEFVDVDINVPTPTVTIGGRAYRIVKIGNQWWTVENLDYKFDGCSIAPSGTPTTAAAWYRENNEPNYGVDGTISPLGLYYNWYAVDKLVQQTASLLPTGWHVPTESEWNTLINVAGGDINACTTLKVTDYAYAGRPDGWGGTDDFGFSMFPCGFYYTYTGDNARDNYFGNFNYAYIWTASPDSIDTSSRTTAMAVTFEPQSYNYVQISSWNKWWAMPIRLVKDA